MIPRILQVVVGPPGGTGRKWAHPLYIQVENERTGGSTPDKSKISLYNLNDTSRSWLEQSGLVAEVLAGEGTPGQLFLGDVARNGVCTKRSGRDWVTELAAATGRRIYRDATFSKAYPPYMTRAQILPDIIAAMAVPTGYISPKLAPFVFVSGWAHCGMARAALTRQLEVDGATWSLPGGRLQILAAGETAPAKGVVISPETGMRGSPEKTDKGMKVTFRLAPEIWPGNPVWVQSSELMGYYKVTKITDKADSRAQQWDSDIVGVPW